MTRPGEPRRGRSLGRTLVVAATVSTIATLTIAVTAVLAFASSQEALTTRRTVHTPATTAAHDLYRALVDQETGARNYVLTGDDRHLVSYRDGQDAAARSIDVLRRLIGDDDSIARALERIELAVATWRRTAAAPEIALRSDGRGDEAVARLASGTGTARFTALRSELEELEHLIQGREGVVASQLNRRVALLGALAIGGAVLSVALAVLAAVISRRWLARPLAALSSEVHQVASGHLDVSIGVRGPVEIASVASDVETMRQMLLDRIGAAFTTGMIEAEQAERARLADQLHDDPVQVLSAAYYRLQAVTLDSPGATAALDPVLRMLEDVQSRLRVVMFELSPPTIATDGLAAALTGLLDDTFEDTGVEVRLVCDAELPGSPATATVVHRLTAEALRNVRQHAGASTVTVTVEADDGVRVRVEDDGVGFDPSVERGPGHRGIQIGRALARAAGGWWQVDSTADGDRSARTGGTTVSFWVPAVEPVVDGTTEGRPAVSDGRRTSGSTDGSRPSPV